MEKVQRHVCGNSCIWMYVPGSLTGSLQLVLLPVFLQQTNHLNVLHKHDSQHRRHFVCKLERERGSPSRWPWVPVSCSASAELAASERPGPAVTTPPSLYLSLSLPQVFRATSSRIVLNCALLRMRRNRPRPLHRWGGAGAGRVL